MLRRIRNKLYILFVNLANTVRPEGQIAENYTGKCLGCSGYLFTLSIWDDREKVTTIRRCTFCDLWDIRLEVAT